MTPERIAALKAINAKARAGWPFAYPPMLLDAVDELIAEVEELTFDIGTKHEALVAGEQLFAVQVANHWHCQGLKQTCDETPINGRNADEIVVSIGKAVRPIVAERDALRDAMHTPIEPGADMDALAKAFGVRPAVIANSRAFTKELGRMDALLSDAREEIARLNGEVARLNGDTLTAIAQDAAARLPEGYSIAIDLFHTHSDVGLYNPEGDEVELLPGYSKGFDDVTSGVRAALAKADEIAASVRQLVADAEGGAK